MFRIKLTDMSMQSKLMQNYCNLRKGLEMNSNCFLKNGRKLSKNQTPAELSMKDYDVVDARRYLANETFTTALAAVPRIWPADRTIMLRRTAKSVKEAVDKMRLPAVVLLSRSFWDNALNDTAAEKVQIVFMHITALTAW